jgi:integrase
MLKRTPKYRLHKPSGQAVVTLSGKDHYLGRYGSTESKAEYDRLVGEWLANHRQPATESSDITVSELISRYLAFADTYYVKNGKPTSEARNLTYAFGPLRRLYGTTLARDFKPLCLENVRQEFIKGDVSRGVINAWVRRIVRMFQWAVSKELVEVTRYQALATVAPLHKGRSEARETKPVKPVPEAYVDAVLPHVSPPVRAILELMRVSGMRPGEAVIMRTIDLDMTGRVWIYIPERHKTEHRGKGREIYLGPAAQEIIRPWLKTDLTAYLFSPREAVAERHAEQRRNRQTPLRPYELRAKPKANPKSVLHDSYSTTAVRMAVRNACLKTGTPEWHPNRLRHNAATRLRREHGVDMARIILGHSDLKTTEIYAEADREKAISIMGKIG